jgi:hypothetical protein
MTKTIRRHGAARLLCKLGQHREPLHLTGFIAVLTCCHRIQLGRKNDAAWRYLGWPRLTRQNRIVEPRRYAVPCRLMPKCCRAVPACIVVALSSATTKVWSAASAALERGGYGGHRRRGSVKVVAVRLSAMAGALLGPLHVQPAHAHVLPPPQAEA